MFAAVSSVAGRTTTEVIEQAKIVPVCRTLQRRIGENHGVGEEGQLDVKYVLERSDHREDEEPVTWHVELRSGRMH